MNQQNLRKIGVSAIPYATAFLLAFIIGIVTYSVVEIAPFGEKTIISLDLWAQYFPMYAEKQQMDSLSDLFWSWNGGLGFNQWAQSAYYTNSIFALLLPLIPLDGLVSFIDWIALVKIALSAVTCLGFLRYKTQSDSPFLIGGAVAYATSSYMLAFIQQIMWTDCMMYLPLLLLGLDRLVHKKKPLLYTLMLAAVLISNYYIGFAVCVFCCIYFAAEAVPMMRFVKNAKSADTPYSLTNVKEFGFSVLRFSVFSILGGAVAAVVLIPAALALGQTISSGLSAPEELTWYGNISFILQNMLPEREVFIHFKGFNVSVGIAAFILVPLYFCSKGIPVRERIADGCVLLFMGISLICNFLDYFWHGMHFPNQYPARWSFLFTFVLVVLSCKALVKIKETSLAAGIISIVIGFAAVLLGVKGYGDTKPAELGVLHWIILAVVAVLLLAAIFCSGTTKTRRTDKKAKKCNTVQYICITLMAAAMMFENGYSFLAVYKNTGERTFRPREREFYQSNLQMESEWGGKYNSGGSQSHRLAANGGFLYDAPMLGDYAGMTYYSSTMREPTYMLMQYLGNDIFGKNVSTMYLPGSTVQNSLFGVRYLLDYRKTLQHYISNAQVAETDTDCTVLENTTALALGYTVSDDIFDLKITDEVRAIQNQDEFLDLLCGEEMGVFTQLATTAFSYSNLNLDSSANWNTLYFTQNGTGTPSFYYTYTCEKDGLFYLENNFRAGTMTVQWDGGSRKLYPDNFKFESLGYFHAGDEITIRVELENVRKGLCGLNLYYFDEDAWQSAYEKLSAEELKVDTFENTYIKGEIDLTGERLLMTTVPQDGGWTVYCDGQKTEPVLIAGELISLRLPAGHHTLELRYRVPGITAGAVISVLGLLLTFGLTSDRLREKVFRQKSEDAEKSEDTKKAANSKKSKADKKA